MRFAPWYERYPERLQQEREAYREAALAFEIDEDMLARHHLVIFKGEVAAGGTSYAMSVVYPAAFPELRPEVLCPGASLDRHQNPYQKNLCLLPNEQDAWSSTDTGASMIEQAVALLATSMADPEAVSAREVDAPEPVSTWYPYSPNACFLMMESLPSLDDGAYGSFTIAVNNPSGRVTQEGKPFQLQALLTKVQAPDRHIWQIPDSLRWAVSPSLLRGSWFKASTPPPPLSTLDDKAGYAAFAAWAKSNHPNGKKGAYWTDKIANEQKGVAVFGVVYPDEGPRRGEYRDNWLVGISGFGNKEPFLLRPFHWTQEERFRRVPSMKGLHDKKVFIVGLGALGSPLAMGLARAGLGHLGIMDYDFVEPGPLVRQEFDLRDIGLSKAAAIMLRAQSVNPNILVTPVEGALGAAPIDLANLSDSKDSLELFAEQIAGYDLLISTAGVTHLDQSLSEIGSALGIPCLFTWVLNGAWGGCVFRSIPGQACFECLRHQYGELPVPSFDPSDVPIYAQGCGFPTFTGTGFDSLAVADLAVRAAVQTVLRGASSTYPDMDGNLINWSSRGSDVGDYPKIERITVPRYDQCRTCRRYQSC